MDYLDKDQRHQTTLELTGGEQPQVRRTLRSQGGLVWGRQVRMLSLYVKPSDVIAEGSLSYVSTPATPAAVLLPPAPAWSGARLRGRRAAPCPASRRP